MPNTAEPASATGSGPPPASKTIVFLRRLVSSIILWAVVIAALFSGNRIISSYFFLFAMLFLSATGLIEFYDIAKRCGLPSFNRWGLFAGLLLIIGTFLNLTGVLGTSGSPARVNDFETSFLILFVLGLCVRQFLSPSNSAGLLTISTTLFGLMYVAWLLNFIQKINFFPNVEGTYYLLYFLVITKFSDTGAYAVGSLFGRHKMIPRISPGKTWEGFGGAIAVAAGASLLFYELFGAHLHGMRTFDAVALGIILGLCAVIGDLIESLFKRGAGMKDSGHLFPGIGGILDLLDSLLFNAPIMYLYLRHVLTSH